MASETVADETATQQTQEAVFSSGQVDKIEDRLVALSQNITLCNSVLGDLEALSDVLVRKSLQDVSITPQDPTEESPTQPLL